MDILNELAEVLQSRKTADPDDSYVASLYAKGLNKILEKVGEEAVEVVIAGKDHQPGNPDLVNEVADLWFHSLVLLTHHDLEPQAVLDTLAERFGVGGFTEKASRT